MTKRKTIYVIDGAGYYYRAYFAIRQFLSNTKGIPTNAVYGFSLMLKRILKEQNPDYLVMTFDSKEKTFRHEQYADYKANRPDMPEDLAEQLPYIDRLVDALKIPVEKEAGWEADDLIGSIVKKARENGYDVVIVTSDKDLMQLVEDGVSIYDSMKEKMIGKDEVIEKFGVDPERVADILGLMGDTSDNIPGVPGVGAKTATALVKEFGDMEGVLTAADGMKKKRLRENLIEFADQARLSKELATIAVDAPITFDPDSWKVSTPDTEKLAALYSELEFTTLLKELAGDQPKKARNYKTILDEKTLNAAIAEMRSSKSFAVDTETTALNPVWAKLVGVSLCAKEGDAYYLPLRHDYENAPNQIPMGQALKLLKPLLEDESVEKLGHNIKYDIIVFASEGIAVKNYRDTMIASYLIDPASRHGLSALTQKRIGETMIEYKEVCGTGQKEITFDKVEIDTATQYAAEDADMTWRLAQILFPEVNVRPGMRGADGNDIETPLIDVLATVEKNGVLVDKNQLGELSSILGGEIESLTAKITELAGEEFNLNSPKQLGEILFEKLKLPGAKKTKTGYSTSQDKLEELVQIHDLPKLMLEYRQMAKLKNTYVDALPKMINPDTGRIHTSFNQTVAATGRLSSSDPNLQNIPVRTETGRKIREAFVAPKDYKIVSADYSQIELRLLAHFAEEKGLIKAFNEGEDIHKTTASEIFDVTPALVTTDMRRVAKTVNFGVIYGQTAFGLSNELKISRADAKRYIDNYFKRYPGISAFIEKTVAQAKKDGFVTTLAGRKRFLPDINAKNRQIRQFAERNAVNTPMQGSAADLIKMAMITIDRRLSEEGFTSKMILQVHDELVFETEKTEVESLSKMVREEMEGVYALLVPLVVDINSGLNWNEAH